MLNKIVIVDFEDSFTYNIASTIFPFCDDVKVIFHQDFFEPNFFNKLENNQKNIGIILGPGPGNPKEYEKYFNQIKFLLNSPNHYLLGICLGHQILGLIEGFEIDDARIKLHGQSELIEYQNKLRRVQRYNSLAVFNKEGEEVNVLASSNFKSFQFHPESVGTEDNIIYFKEILEFIYQK